MLFCFACAMFQTPNRTKTTNPKARALFQSPLALSRTKPLSTKITITKSTLVPQHYTTVVTTTPDKKTEAKSISPLIANLTLASLSTTVSETNDSLANSEYELLSETIIKLQQSFTTNQKSIVSLSRNQSESDIIGQVKCDLKLRYKSEPNLSQIIKDHDQTNIQNSLLKGISMVDVSAPSLAIAHTPIRPCTRKSVTYAKRYDIAEECTEGEEEDIDDPDFEATPNSQASYRECLMDTSNIMTPHFLGRKSMSPITKSTQRMSKAMQVCNIFF